MLVSDYSNILVMAKRTTSRFLKKAGNGVWQNHHINAYFLFIVLLHRLQ